VQQLSKERTGLCRTGVCAIPVVAAHQGIKEQPMHTYKTIDFAWQGIKEWPRLTQPAFWTPKDKVWIDDEPD
jgi:hypothetical protein